MNVKTIVQLLIFFVIIFFLYFFIKNTFFVDDIKVADIDLEEKEKNALEIDNSEKENEQSNIIKIMIFSNYMMNLCLCSNLICCQITIYRKYKFSYLKFI